MKLIAGMSVFFMPAVRPPAATSWGCAGGAQGEV